MVEAYISDLVKRLIKSQIYPEETVKELIDVKIGFAESVTLELIFPDYSEDPIPQDDFEVGFKINYNDEELTCQVYIQGEGPNPSELLMEIKEKDALIQSLKLQLSQLQEQISKTDRQMIRTPSLPYSRRREDIARTSRTSFVEKVNISKDIVFISRKNSCDDLISRPVSKQIKLRTTPSIPELATPRLDSSKNSLAIENPPEVERLASIDQSQGSIGLPELFKTISYEAFDLPYLFKTVEVKELKPKKPDKPKPTLIPHKPTLIPPKPRILRRKIITRPKKSKSPKHKTPEKKHTARSRHKSLPPVKQQTHREIPQQQQGPPPPLAASCILTDEDMSAPMRRNIYTADRTTRVVKRPRPPPKSHTMIQMRRPKPRQEVIEDLIYSHEYDNADKWRKVLETLRDQPKLLSKMLEPTGKYTPIHLELSNSLNYPEENKPATPLFKPPLKLALPSLQPSSFESSSGGKISQGHQTISSEFSLTKEEIFDRPQSITVDWSDSVLNSYVSAGFIEFNWENDPDIFSEIEIRELLKVFLKKEFDIEEHELLFRRAAATLERVSFELVLDANFDYKISHEGFLQMLRDLKKLLETRSLTAVILKKIHQREDILEHSNRDSSTLDKELLALIASWKKSVPYGDLLYEGMSYMSKIRNERLRDQSYD